MNFYIFSEREIFFSFRFRIDKMKPNEQPVTLPVYLNATRAQLLFTLEFSGKDNPSDFYKRGVAIISSNIS